MPINSTFASVVAAGVKGYAGEKFKEEDRQRGRFENRKAIQRKAAEDELGTNLAVAQNDPKVIQQQMDMLAGQNRQLLNTQAKTESFDAMRRFSADGNVQHLNNALRNPAVAEQWGNALVIDKIDLVADRHWLRANSVDLAKFDNEDIDKEAFLNRYVKVTMPDGSKTFADTSQFKIASGYNRMLTQEQLQEELLRSQVVKNVKGPKGVDPIIQRTAQYIAEQGHATEKEASGALYRKEIAGVTPGKQDIADIAEQTLEGIFEVPATDTTEGKDFFTTDFTLPANRTKAARHIRRLEQLGGVELKAADRADLKDINVLIAAGKTVAEELTPEATGILDNFTAGVRKYMSDESVPTTQARAAYNAYRNALLRAFGGTAMSESEVKNFNAAFGTLAQKYPAVISQFKQAITQTKAKLDTIAQLNDPYIAHYYLGKSQDDIDIIYTRLDRTLDELNGVVAPEQAAATKSWKDDWKAQ